DPPCLALAGGLGQRRVHGALDGDIRGGHEARQQLAVDGLVARRRQRDLGGQLGGVFVGGDAADEVVRVGVDGVNVRLAGALFAVVVGRAARVRGRLR